ncbi:MAG: hypothetical protein FWG25_01545 [Promicromonosporaceae bacterium]|nr:hypothetical protein [Promicromonosporaceae bacterium]
MHGASIGISSSIGSTVGAILNRDARRWRVVVERYRNRMPKNRGTPQKRKKPNGSSSGNTGGPKSAGSGVLKLPNALIENVRRALRDEDFTVLLHILSMAVAIDEFPDDFPDAIEHGFAVPGGLPELARALAAHSFTETTALLTAIAYFGSNAAAQEIARKELVKRRQRLPIWLQDLREAKVADDPTLLPIPESGLVYLLLGVSFVGGDYLTLFLYLDGDFDGGIRDGAIFQESVSETLDMFSDVVGEALPVQDIKPADARAVIEHGLAVQAPRFNDPESAWPDWLPFTRWVATYLLPEGGEVDDSWFEPTSDADAYDDFVEEVSEMNAARVGGFDELENLDQEPLPDEAFAWAGVPEDLREIVTELLDLLDQCADELPGLEERVEFRTAFRRFLARLATVGQKVLRRRASVTNTACAIAWAVLKANDAFELRVLSAKDLAEWFGINAVPIQRGQTLIEAIGGERVDGDIFLATPGLLTGATRTHIDMFQARIESDSFEAMFRGQFRDLGSCDHDWHDDDGGGHYYGDDFVPHAYDNDDDDDAEPESHVPGAALGAAIKEWNQANPGQRVRHVPGMTARHMETMRPYLLEEGLDLDNLEGWDIDAMNHVMARATDRYNLDLFTPRGIARERAVDAMREVTSLLLTPDLPRFSRFVESQIVPESIDDSQAEVSSVIGMGLTLLDLALTGRNPDAPRRFAGEVPVLVTKAKGRGVAAEIIELAAQGTAFASLDHLSITHGGLNLLHGVLLAVASAARHWAGSTQESHAEVIPKLIS